MPDAPSLPDASPGAPVPSAKRKLGRGLRAKAVLLLLAVVALAITGLLLAGHSLLQDVRAELGTALAQDHARITQQKIRAKVGLELALSRRLAESEAFSDWLMDEGNDEKRARAWREAGKIRLALADGNWFAVSARSHHFFFADTKSPEPKLSYTVKPGNPDDAWYFKTLARPDGRTINVDFDKHLKATKVWINVVARDSQGGPTGVVGTGLDLTRFLAELLNAGERGATTMIVDRNGAIVAHPDTSRMEFALAGKSGTDKTIYRLLDAASAPAVQKLLERMAGNPDDVPTVSVTLDGQPRLLALAAAPSLGWIVVTAVNLDTSDILTPKRLFALSAAAIFFLALLLIGMTLALDHLALAPLAQLTESVRRIAGGHYDVRLSSERADELGDLTRAFDTMAQQVQAYSANMERIVEERTRELAQAHLQLTDSIQYARLIQNAILPDADLEREMAPRHFVLWQPRDVVGGDFYFYRAGPAGVLLGVVDCAGHGVPGACMTMAAHAAVVAAAETANWRNPAAILTQVDRAARATFPGGGRVVASMDAGFCHFQPGVPGLRFAGARLSLFWCNGVECGEMTGCRRSLNERRLGRFTTVELMAGPDTSYYLVSDGLLDQAGGADGHAYGSRRFKEWMLRVATRPLEEQRDLLAEEIRAYQGHWPRRDDITVFAFRLDTPATDRVD